MVLLALAAIEDVVMVVVVTMEKKIVIISCAGQTSALFIFPIVSFAKVHRSRNE